MDGYKKIVLIVAILLPVSVVGAFVVGKKVQAPLVATLPVKNGDTPSSTSERKIFNGSVVDQAATQAPELKAKATEAGKSFHGLFFGDMMLDRHVGERIRQNGLASLLKNINEEVKPFVQGTDLVSANLEGATTDGGAHYAPVLSNDFAFSPKTVGELKNYSFNFFNIANNHLTDQGQKGVAETSKNLAALGFGFSGCGDRQVGDCSGAVREFNGTKVALLGFSMVYGDFDLKAAKEKVAEAKKRDDFVVVNVHWGSEYTHQFSKKQQAVGHVLIDAGADAIIGHHPHVVQGIEVYKEKPIFYSLGNFIFDQYFSKDTQEGLAVKVNLEKDSIVVNLHPLKQKRSAPELMKGKEKDDFLTKLNGWSFGDELVKKQIKNGVLVIPGFPPARE